MKRKILVVDDEQHIVEFLAMNLRQNGYDVIYANNGLDGVKLAKEEMPDCILLDIMLPSINGLEVCRILKQDHKTTDIPIIMLSAKSEESDKVIGLGLGADDYITKPFGVRELFARIEVVLRRNNQQILSSKYELIDLVIDFDNYTVQRNVELIDLTRTEFNLLVFLINNKNKVISRNELANAINVSSETRAIDVHILNIRKKLDSNNPNKYIETVRGVGFRIQD